jgi:hypothetical protein
LSNKPEYIIHLMGRTNLLGKNIKCYKSNYTVIKNLIKECQKILQIKKVIFASILLVNKLDYLLKLSSDYNLSEKSKEKLKI